MSAQRSVYRRVLRRETHSSRAGAAITVAVCLVLVLAAAGVGCVFLAVHAPAVAAARAGFSELSVLRGGIRPAVFAGGAAAVVLGVVIVVLGVLPGRRPRRALASDRAAIVVDDSVIADALAARAVSAAAVASRQVRVVVARRRAMVRVIPTSGIPVDAEAVRASLASDAARYGLSGGVRVRVAERGVVG